MANAIYQKFKTSLGVADSNVSLNQDTANDGPYCALIDTGTYTYSAAHQFYNPSLTGIVGTPVRITTPTFGSVSEGTFDGADVTFTAVTGNSVEALVIYRHNVGADTTWRLTFYQDTSVTGLPVTPNGGNIVVTWDASGIFTLSDRDAKENVVPIDELFGRLTLYRFNYGGEERTRVGLMAQEVERIVPAAVIRFGDRRRRAVDYRQVIEKLAA